MPDQRKTSRASTRPRAQLDRDTILDAGLRLAATGTGDAVSVRKLGAELGADPTAVYRHFRDKDELVLALIDRLVAQVGEALEATQWREMLHEFGLQTVDVMAAHPAIGIEVGVRSTGGPGERDAIERILAALNEAGLDDDTAVRFYGVYTSYVLAFAGATSAGRLSTQTQYNLENSLWVGPLNRVDKRRHPHVARNAGRLIELTDRDVFETGLTVILDAAEAAAAAGRSA